MAEPSNAKSDALHPPPDLPDRLTNPWRPVLIGTTIWLILLVVLLIMRLGETGPSSVWMWTALTGTVLGGIGLAIMTWQRAASRRGSRSAQRGL